MRKKIAILGSTGSIGKQTLEIIKDNKSYFNIILLSTNKNLKEISKQVKIFKPKNLIITNTKKFNLFKKKNKKVNIFNNYSCFKKIFRKKIDYAMSSISGFDGLQPTIEIIKHTKTIAIANKESIICGWNLIEKQLKRNNTQFVPIDSEHFSIWSLLNNKNENIDSIYITASGGPFLNKKKTTLKNVKPIHAISHPKWKMGKKISVDSATMINKIFEILEAKKIFNVSLKKLKILLHPDSYVHAIVKFKNGITKMLIHETSMKVPIFNSLYQSKQIEFKSKAINFNKLNNLKFKKISKQQFPSIGIIKEFNNTKDSLYETVLVSANDELVNMFLNEKIEFLQISRNLMRIMKLKEFKKFKSKKASNIGQIVNLNKYVRLKTRSLCVRSYNNA